MKAYVSLLICPILLLFLTACSQEQPQEENILESNTLVTETIYPSDADADTLQAITYQGITYYGIVFFVKDLNSSLDEVEYPENAILLGKTSSDSEIVTPYYTHTPSPSEELQTNWTSPEAEIYAVFDKNGNPVEFYSTCMNEKLVKGEVVKLASLTTEKPEYYDAPEI